MTSATTSGPQSTGSESGQVTGVCFIFFAFDIAFAIDLDAAERRIAHIRPLAATASRAAESTGVGAPGRISLARRRKAPSHFEYRPAPLRAAHRGEAIDLNGFSADPVAECTLFDFGAVSIAYRVPVDCPLEDLRALSERTYDNQRLVEDARRRAIEVIQILGDALSRPSPLPAVHPAVEDYVIFHLQRPIAAPAAMLASQRATLAQILRADTSELSEDEIRDALACRISFSPDDIALIDWHAAMVFDDDAQDVISILEFVNVELLEMRVLDDRLDSVLEAFYAAMSQRRMGVFRGALSARHLARLATLQTDSALLFEGVNNALKLVGDQYLARVYRLAAERMRLADWDGSILRKLSTVESIYSKIREHQAAQRMEILEWIIIILIAVSILVMFVPTGGH